MTHIAQDVLSGNPRRTRPHKPTAKEPAAMLAAEYARSLLPWAQAAVQGNIAETQAVDR